MERVIVTVKLASEARVRDIELSANVPIEQLARVLAQRLGWSQQFADQQVTYDVDVHPPGRRLNPKETLAQANAWDGAWLVFHPRPLAAEPEPSMFNVSWEPLDLSSPKTASEPIPAQASASPDTGQDEQLLVPRLPSQAQTATPAKNIPPPAEGGLKSAQPEDSPVIGWEPIALPSTPDAPAESKPAPAEPDAPRGWRRIDS
jgi:hypothetical protein